MSDRLARIAGVRGLREVEVTEQVTHVRATMTSEASEASEYEQLAVQYLEMARGLTGDPSQASVKCPHRQWLRHTRTPRTTPPELSKKGAEARLSLLTLRADPCARTNL